MQIGEWKKWFSQNREAIFQDFFAFLRFKSIGTDPEFDEDTSACARWLVDYLKKIGLDTELWQSPGQPVVFAENTKAGKDRPTLLIYHHYDVQPVDPLELWKSDPFEPSVKNGQVFARGAQDNKGQCFYSITAVRALLETTKKLGFNVKLFIEGEEESGSVGTIDILQKKKDRLKSDYLLVVDSGIPGPGIPAITLGIRGILTLEIDVRTANSDLHSGSMGGIAYNPIRALAHAFSQCWDESGRIAIPHFYDNVEELSEEEKKQYHLRMDEKKIKEKFGLRALAPEPGFSIGESVSIRPTFEINGISGGYAGEGFKTVLPAVSHAKVSCRLVPHQDPEVIFQNFDKHFREQFPFGIEVKVKKEQGEKAFRCDPNSLIAKHAIKGYEEVLKKPCQLMLMGGSIPITPKLVDVTKAEAVMMGYGLDDDNIHAPNEHFGLDRFEQGFLTMGRIFEEFNAENQ